MSKDYALTVSINPATLVKVAEDSREIVINPGSEKALLKLLAIQREVNDAVEAVKSEIERRALEFNPNFRAIKGERVKITYSASGAKYRATGEALRHSPKYWQKRTTWSLNTKALDEHLARRGNLPAGIASVERKKTIRISEVVPDAE